MKWDSEALQRRFKDKQLQSEADLRNTRKYKKKSPFYESFVDDDLGKVILYSEIRDTAALESKESFLEYLQELLMNDDLEGEKAFDLQRVKNSCKNEIENLIKEFDKT
jgi:hypothetical protein